MKTKAKFLAMPLAAALLLGACGEDDKADEIEVEDPMLEDNGENDIGG
ncbi:hypothetical protein MHH33_17795 [Paenisporosarcina sp. FSL H8-0542]|nr:hypothetical protein [Paenisporosarcina sp. HGH0030]EPD50850.1 hypothetical protein HMPREF1210_02358 [Paenisporosarcina sp. HGH0030]